ncbi:cytochrome-c peroxidase [Deminuibacter soli]|uniref:Cytochrome-c peroxidase n=1 Tax=Deminuibacter soli TaxID=2291815 RepID=A0A3E1NGV2_9BACT|nr:cytochrome c peroxidase [Deminuibacter soli]RFM27081.1 cytochrome-c peroxidase [Deminuibacter soli]
MKRWLYILFITACIAAGSSFIAREAVHTPTIVHFDIPEGWPKPVYPFKENPLTQEGIALGRRLFYDGRLSKDGNFPCASCHQQFAAFSTYDHSLSHGYNYTLTTRNAPALFNLAWQASFMHDGGINHLDLQPLAPLTAPNEMAETIDSVLKKLRADTSYRKQFTAAFGDATINTRRTMQALSQFLLTLVSAGSKYDRVQRGTASFNLPERLGYAIFRQKCASCHAEPLFTDFSYRNIGLPADTTLNDLGRMRITHHSTDSLKFKVPSLRNVAVTAPYGHDGRFYSIDDVLQHYRSGVVNTPTTDPLLQKGIPLSNFEIGQLKAFLYTLTDSAFITDKRFGIPASMVLPAAPDAGMHAK